MSSSSSASGGQTNSYLGKTLSVISKAKMRYVGTLVSIDNINKKIIMNDVKSYGSEGRLGGGNSEIIGNNQFLESVVFNANELEDFYVVNLTMKNDLNAEINSKIEGQSLNSAKNQNQEEKINYNIDNNPLTNKINNPQNMLLDKEKEMQYYPNYYSYNYVYGELKQNPNKYILEKFKQEFDITGMNNKFEALFRESGPKREIQESYNKTASFFDKISTSINDPKCDIEKDIKDQRKIDQETFGYSQSNPRRRGEYYRRPRGRFINTRFRQNYETNYEKKSYTKNNQKIIYVKKESKPSNN